MDQYYYSTFKPQRVQKPENEKQEITVLRTECERIRTSCNELIDSKIKLSVLNLKLWIVTSVVMFLLGTGSTFVCGLRSYGKIEEKVETISENQQAQEKQIEALRQEIWKIIPIGRYATSGTTAASAGGKE